MVLRFANGVHATGIFHDAADLAQVLIADLVVGALIVAPALDQLTADFVVSCISEETGIAGTRRDVIVSLAGGVSAAQYQVASFTTFRL